MNEVSPEEYLENLCEKLDVAVSNVRTSSCKVALQNGNILAYMLQKDLGLCLDHVANLLFRRESSVREGCREIEQVLAKVKKLSESEPPTHDVVNHPQHYTKGDVECIDAIESALGPEGFIAFLRGQVIKYQWRLGFKDKASQDNAKAGWYVKKLQEKLDG